MSAVLLNRTSVESLLKRAAFYEKMPEFRRIKDIPEPNSGGCRSCRGRRVSRNRYNAFVQTLSSLSPDAVDRLKKYMNADSIQFIGYDDRTKRTETIKL